MDCYFSLLVFSKAVNIFSIQQLADMYPKFSTDREGAPSWHTQRGAPRRLSPWLVELGLAMELLYVRREGCVNELGELLRGCDAPSRDSTRTAS
jgi:hypothetical protein